MRPAADRTAPSRCPARASGTSSPAATCRDPRRLSRERRVAEATGCGRHRLAHRSDCNAAKEPAWPGRGCCAGDCDTLPGRMPKTALITGITGQDGSYLAELLLEKGYEVHGMVRRASTEKFERIEHLRDRITLHQGDLLDQRSLVDTLRAAKPDEIYNLAAMSLRRRLVDPADADRRVHRRRRDAHARGDARGLPRGALLPGVLERDVRQGPRDPADRGDAVLPALALRRGEGLRALHHGQLPRVLRPARDERDPLQPRVAAPRAGVRHAQDHLARRGDQARAARRAARSATSTPSATGATPRTTSRRCG